MTLETSLFGHPITVSAEPLDEGWDISVAGGCKTHVGAVTLAAPGKESQTVQRPGHRDGQISCVWAETLSQKWNCPVCVRCGIHYDGIRKEQIVQIVDACSRLLEQLTCLRKQKD